jgi:enoyl-CoA hydratase
MADEAVVLTDERDGVLLMTFNRPDQRNCVNKAVAVSMAEALERLDAEPQLSVGVLTGAGKGFCAGMDLKAFASGEFPTVEGRGFAGITQRSAAKPLIAAVEGFALAGGLEVALACDLIVAGKGARLGIPEVKVGLFAGAGALWKLPRRVGIGKASLLALSGEPILAEEAAAIGLVDRLAETGEALNVALDLAKVIAGNAPLGVRASKAVINEGFTQNGDEFWQWQSGLFPGVFKSKDALEGARAFAEKRAPNWQGH